MDAFFVSVEELFDPALKGKAVVVGGRPNERGVVSAASYEARKFGVHSAMPLRTAARLCPHAIFVDGHPTVTAICSARVRETLNRFSPLVEMASIDEAYLDMTGTERLHGPPLRAAHALHQTMKAETRLNCSIGISTARLVSKVASDQAKPNGVLWIMPGLGSRVSGAAGRAQDPRSRQGHRTESAPLSIRKVGDLARLDEPIPRRALRQVGTGPGRQSARPGCGRLVRYRNRRELRSQVDQPRAHLQRRHQRSRGARIHAGPAFRNGRPPLRENGLHARTLQLKLRYSDFSTITRAHSVERPTQLDTEIFDEARALFLKNWKPGARVRLLGVQASSFEEVRDQLDLLDEGKHERWQQATGRRRPAARQVWRLRRVAGRRTEGRLPRANATRRRHADAETRKRGQPLDTGISMPAPIHIVGGGLAGSEAAWQIAEAGLTAVLHEMRPVRPTAAHQTDRLAELVCSNSLKSEQEDSAPWLLKQELRRLGSLVLRAAAQARVPGGHALTVDRDVFSAEVTRAIAAHPRIEIRREEVREVPDTGITIIATGP
jgi:DNA polymerase-4